MSRIYDSLVRQDVPVDVAAAIDAKYHQGEDTPAGYLEKLSLAIYDAAEDFGASRRPQAPRGVAR